MLTKKVFVIRCERITKLTGIDMPIRSANEIKEIISLFDFEGENISFEPYGNGQFCYIRDSFCWRAYSFIEDSICIERPDSTDDFYECAVAFSRFQKNLNGFPADTLHETIPHFHDTVKRFADFSESVKNDLSGRAKNVTEEIMLLPEGTKMMTIECRMRFLADYIDGDTYFKTSHSEQNLDRARTHFKLVADMERHWDEMKAIVKKYS